jgi:glycogen(starch) synthase
LKIIHADTDDLDNPLRGGQPVRTYEINTRIAKRHDVAVWTAVFPGAAKRKIRDGVMYQRLGVHIKPFGLSPHLSYLSCLGPKLLSVTHDIVVEEFMPPFGFCLLPWWTRKPVVSVVQWYFFEFWEQRYHLPFQRCMRAIAGSNRYRYFIVQTNTMAHRLHQLIPDAVIEKIPCGINPDAFGDPVRGGDFALFLGRLDCWQKGLDFLLEAWRRYCRKQNIPLIIAGEGPDHDILRKHVEVMGLQSLVTFAGRVTGDHKKALIASCRFMVMPSRQETFGISALEAMAAGKPVIAFDIESLNELIGAGCGILVPPADAWLYGKAVCRLWDDRSACFEMGQRAHQNAHTYLWKDQAQRQLNFYQRVLETVKK